MQVGMCEVGMCEDCLVEEGGGQGRGGGGGKFYCEKGDLVGVGGQFPVAMEIDYRLLVNNPIIRIIHPPPPNHIILSSLYPSLLSFLLLFSSPLCN